MASLGNIELRVTPEELFTKSQEVITNVKAMREYFDNLRGVMEKTEWYWRGKAGNRHRKAYVDMNKKVDELMKRLSEHPRDLMEIAQTYSEVEMKIEDEAMELPGDILL